MALRRVNPEQTYWRIRRILESFEVSVHLPRVHRRDCPLAPASEIDAREIVQTLAPCIQTAPMHVFVFVKVSSILLEHL